MKRYITFVTLDFTEYTRYLLLRLIKIKYFVFTDCHLTKCVCSYPSSKKNIVFITVHTTWDGNPHRSNRASAVFLLCAVPPVDKRQADDSAATCWHDVCHNL